MKTIIYLILGVLIFSCTKKNEPGGHLGPSCDNPNHSYITSADLLNTRFKTGTYWIYLDSITLTVDSEYVYNHTQSTHTQSENCDTYEYFQYQTKHYPSLAENIYLMVGSIIYKGPKSMWEGITIYTDFNKAKSNTTDYTTYDSLYIYDRYYKKVIKTSRQYDYTLSNLTTSTYMNSEFGILKLEVFDSPSQLKTKKLLIRNQIIK